MRVRATDPSGVHMIPYQDIIESADRHWTLRLLARLDAPDLGEPELADVVEALSTLSDARSTAPLEAIVCDPARPERIRQAASDAIRGYWDLDIDTDPDTLRRWWQHGDTILRTHALSCMNGRRCPDIVLEVAADPRHPLQAIALGRMIWLFDRPEHERIKIAALAHPDPEVRATAADVLLIDEPLAAEEPLLRATADPVAAVAEAAANTLQYYPTARTIRRLFDLQRHPDPEVRGKAEDGFRSIRADIREFLRTSNPAVAARVHRWLAPVRDVLAFTDAELRPDSDDNESSATGEVTVRATIPLAELLALLGDPDVSPLVLKDRLGENDWLGYSEDDYRRLRPALLAHADPLVRQQAADVLDDWHDTPGLLALLQDRDHQTRKSAMYHLGKQPPDPALAEVAWQHFLNTRDFYPPAALETYVRHAAPSVAVGRLFDMAADAGQREALRTSAVYHLVALQARDEIVGLTGVLTRPPTVTWALHLAILHAIDRLDLPRNVPGFLRDVDHLAVQEALAKLDSPPE